VCILCFVYVNACVRVSVRLLCWGLVRLFVVAQASKLLAQAALFVNFSLLSSPNLVCARTYCKV
jgi:hypothetical protein